MDNKYRITVTDLETGQRADYGGLPGQCDTDFGLICAMGGHSDAGDVFYNAIVANHDRGVSRSELIHLMDAVFHSFSSMIREDKDPGTVFALSIIAFTRYVKNEVKEPLLRSALYSNLAGEALKAAEAERK